MGKIRDLFTGEHRGFFIFAAGVTAFTFVYLAIGPGNNLIRWAKAKIDIAGQERQIREYQEDIERMERRIRMLTSDRDTLERFARERFLFAEPGDEVFLVDER
ncbi:MAG: septum formation initiator family protein [Bacteroidales bacterium]|nr:septum formation initiator family protein [Bacteroidales bacterium]